MLIAYNPTNQQKIEAIPHTQAECPHCHQKVISKCGSIRIWHWSHESKCIYHTESETDWHLQWKKIAIKNKCEIEVGYEERKHIADAVIRGKVIEFQHSSITSEEIISRSIFYNNVDWVFDYRGKASNTKYYKRNSAP